MKSGRPDQTFIGYEFRDGKDKRAVLINKEHIPKDLRPNYKFTEFYFRDNKHKLTIHPEKELTKEQALRIMFSC